MKKFNNKTLEILCLNTALPEIAVAGARYVETKEHKCTLQDYACTQYHVEYIRSRGDKLIPSVMHVQKLLDTQLKNISCIGLIIGPGSFTGLRNALAFSKAVAVNYAIPIVGLTLHDCIAWQYGLFEDNLNCEEEGSSYVIVSDARSKKYYVAMYSSGVKFSQSKKNIYDMSIDEIPTLLKDTREPIKCIGPVSGEVIKYLEHQKNVTKDTPRMSLIEALRDFTRHCYKNEINLLQETAEPLYIRNEV